MFRHNLEMHHFFLSITLLLCSSAAKHEEIFNFGDLLRNLNGCDIQILYSWGLKEPLFFEDLNLVTTMFMPMDDKALFSHARLGTAPAMDVLNSRVSKCRLSFILVSTKTDKPNDDFAEQMGVQLAAQTFHKRENYWIRHSHTNFGRSSSFRHIFQMERNYWARLQWSLLQIYGKIRMIKVYLGNDVELIYTKFEDYHFLTCYTEPYISFYFYFSPFQYKLWVVLAISIVTIVSITTTAVHYLREKQHFSAWLFVLATLFEETGFLPSKIEKHTFFRFTLGTWCLMSVILTNCYNGIMITELNAPLKLFHPDTFDHLRCRQNYMVDIVEYYHIKLTAKANDSRRIEQEVVQCGKTVFIAKLSELKLEYEFLSRMYPRTKFFISSKGVLGNPSGCIFIHPWRSRVAKGVQSVTEAGILRYAENQDMAKFNFKRTPAMEQPAGAKSINIATLSGALLTVFILTGGLICATILVFIVESRNCHLLGQLQGSLNLTRFRIWKNKFFGETVVATILVHAQDKGRTKM
ncbi:hypothetical protein Fcan01_18949 [Folsomia candida]|uniref:Uncharacterized protein n=1 Tax=Folsomia candida TaxID=158441 RepID=A0A226DKY9_FOLCA|nr:hypothetical protein Fcan01_18949 [Folsomia candida]